MEAEDIELIRDTYNKAYEKGKKAGEKKVAEWIKTHQMPDNPSSEPYPGLVLISKSQLEEFLKSEGIE